MSRLAALSLLLAVLLAGCGGIEKGGLTSVGTEEPTTSPSEVRSFARVDMQEIAFSPKTLRIRPGGNVTWVNRDKVAHTVTVGNELYNSLDSGELEPGQRYNRVFNKRRKIGYRCTIHPNMEGTIFVRQD
ncbi:MAG: plastocyanin/azurin family copper-binding protein [Actinomycetota bacterium]|nr:plastocyanin/azurin family copper-binding protein [Actinomycetota bacterium]MDQ3647358.1 plastocyanin/azurin family copper-binding protein [Actinomycetota bacterium]